MIHIKDVSTMDGSAIDLSLPSEEERSISANGLVLLPALIDSHVHFRTPGLEYKENWETAARAAIQGGITTVFDMPNTIPPTVTLERLEEKQALIDQQLKAVGIPLHYGLYLGADKSHFEQIVRCKKQIVGIKVFMGSSTGDLVMDDESSLHAIFSLAASHNLLLAVHAEDENLIQQRKEQFKGIMEPRVHSEIRNEEVALRATQKAIELARIYHTRLHILHVGTKSEIQCIERAKKEGLKISVETTPHHLFLTIDDYKKQGTKVQMNPPLRTQEDVEAIWQALHSGVVDTIGSDHAPHTLQEKSSPYGQAPSGIPGVEITVPLLLNACCEGRITLKQIVRLMRDRVMEIFDLPENDDYILIDMKKKVTIDEHSIKSKCRWSPYIGKQVQGWPVYTILRGRVYEL